MGVVAAVWLLNRRNRIRERVEVLGEPAVSRDARRGGFGPELRDGALE